MGITEDSINSSIFLELKNLGLNIKTQVTTKIHGKTYKPDFYIQNDLKIYGEGEWQKSVATGLSQAATYLDDPSVDASFTIIYSNDLERVIKALSDEEDLHEILRTQIFHIYYKKKNEPSAHKRVKYNDLKSFFKEILHKEVPYKPDIDIFIETINLLANEIFKLLPEVNRDTLKLYQNILGSQDDLNSPNVDFDIIARNAAGYLFINQLIFYAILANKRADFSHINVNNLHSLSDLKNYFIKVINLDFKPVFSIDVISQFQEESLEKVKEIIRSIQFLGPEYIKSDVIGRIFHKLIPSNVRKKVAAYYTKPESAELLAFLAIKDYKINVLDPACGSGQLLIASYKRIKQLYEINTAEIFNEKIHANILENQLTGIDIMPFSAHLSLINLTLQNLNFITNQLRIAIYDSSKLTKDKEITPLQAFLRQVQKSITQYLKTNKRDTKNRKKVEKLIGSITLDGKAGTSFSIKDIDLVIMNPPFTRQELINKLSSNSEKQYKKRLIANITKGPYKRYQDYLNEKQSFSSYFLFLADKILDDRGIIASVLPVTILRDKVNMGLRKFLLNNYSLMFVIIRYDTLNFSDDTTFREILFIAKKGIPKKDHIVTYISLNRLYSGIGSDIKYQEEFILGEGIYDCKNFTVEKVAQSSLNSSNLFGPIALKSPDLLKIWQEALRSKIFTKKTRSLKANEGARSRKYGLVPEMCIVEELDSRTKFKFIDITSRNSHKNIEFESIGHIKYNIWQQNTFYYCRSASHKTMNIGSLNEFVIHKIEKKPYFEEINPKIYELFLLFNQFKDKFKREYKIELDDLSVSKKINRTKRDIVDFLKEKIPDWTQALISIFGDNAKEIVKHTRKMVETFSFKPYQKKWKNYLRKKLCYIGTIETFHIEAPNTYFFAYYSGEHKRVFSSIFNNVYNLTEEEAKINCLWLNSSLNFLQLFVERVPTGWFKIRQYVLESLKIFNLNNLNDEEKKQFIKIFDEICDIEFPCIWKQIFFNIPSKYKSQLNGDLICETFNIELDDYEKMKTKSFPPRRILDFNILKVLLQNKNEKELNSLLDKIYFLLIDEIIIAKRLIS